MVEQFLDAIRCAWGCVSSVTIRLKNFYVNSGATQVHSNSAPLTRYIITGSNRRRVKYHVWHAWIIWIVQYYTALHYKISSQVTTWQTSALVASKSYWKQQFATGIRHNPRYKQRYRSKSLLPPRRSLGIPWRPWCRALSPSRQRTD